MRRPGRRPTRNAGSGPAFLPSKLSGLVLWLRADMGITIAGSGVSQWNDQSGTGDANKHNVQGTDANRPTYNTSDAGYNGKPTLQGTGTQFLTATGNWAVAPPRPATIFVVGNGEGGANNCVFFSDASVSQYQFWESGLSNSPNTVAMSLNATLFTPAITNTALKHIYAIDLNGAATKIFQDSLTAAVTGNAGTTGGLRVDACGGSGSSFGGKQAEIIIYNTRLSATDFASVMNYLASRYAVTLV